MAAKKAISHIAGSVVPSDIVRLHASNSSCSSWSSILLGSIFSVCAVYRWRAGLLRARPSVRPSLRYDHRGREGASWLAKEVKEGKERNGEEEEEEENQDQFPLSRTHSKPARVTSREVFPSQRCSSSCARCRE